MDIANIVTQGLQTAFSVLNSEVIAVDFHKRRLDGAYDPLTNSYPTDVYLRIPVLQSQFDYRELNASQISIRDKKLIIKKINLPVVPAEGDFFVSGEETWDVVRTFDYPGVFILGVRRR